MPELRTSGVGYPRMIPPRFIPLLKAAALRHNVTYGELISDSRAPRIMQAKCCAYRELRRLQLSYERIGMIAGRSAATVRDHIRAPHSCEMPPLQLDGDGLCLDCRQPHYRGPRAKRCMGCAKAAIPRYVRVDPEQRKQRKSAGAKRYWATVPEQARKERLLKVRMGA